MQLFGLTLRLGAATLVAMFALSPAAAFAQDVPSYAQPVSTSTDETIHGRIASVDGAFNIHVDDDRGFVDSVVLHQGTIINPTGLSLSPGMSVSILGYNAGSVFDANEIDTPYNYSGPLPTPVYYGPGYWCPGFDYGYGPSFSLAIVIGFGGGFDRFEHRPFYGRPWDGQRYFGGYVGHAYDGRGDGGRGAGTRIDGGPRHLLGGGGETRRGFNGEHATSGHVPSGFAGRSFAGRAYSGQTGTGVQTRRYAPAPAARAGFSSNGQNWNRAGAPSTWAGGATGAGARGVSGTAPRSMGGFGGGAPRSMSGFSGAGPRSSNGFGGGAPRSTGTGGFGGGAPRSMGGGFAPRSTAPAGPSHGGGIRH